MSSKRHILIRFDDICPTMDWKQWQKAMDVFTKYNIKPLLGIIPDCMDPDLQICEPRRDFWDYIRDLQKNGFTIAMHGYQHIFDSGHRGVINNTQRSEFAGHSFEKQVEKIKRGKEILDQNGIETDVFFAPAHSYDLNTLKALAAAGFHTVSDGKSAKPFIQEGILCLPCRSSGCPHIRGNGYYTAVFHAHEWTRPDKAKGYEQLLRLCEEHSSDICSFPEYINQPTGKKEIQKANEEIYMTYEYKIRPILSKIKHHIVR